MATLTYNDVSLAYVDTQAIEQQFVRDPSSVEHLYVHYKIRVRTLLTRGKTPLEEGEDPATGCTRIVEKLRLPRRRLIYKSDDGETLIDTQETVRRVDDDGNFYSLDDANGPFPLYANISQITTETYQLEFGVEAKMRIPCDATGLSFPDGQEGILSLRWSESNSYDSRWLCTRRRVGYLIVSGYWASNPDQFRNLVTPRVPAGFRRESAHYEISEDGLTYRFTFVDKEMMRPPPAPAIKMRGRMIESTPQLGGAVRWGEITIALEGPKGVDKLDLLARAVRIGMSRVEAAGVVRTKNTGMAIVQGSVSESLNDDENSIELSIRWMMKPNVQRTAGAKPAPGFFGRLGFGAAAMGGADGFKAANQGGNVEAGAIVAQNNIGINVLGLPSPGPWVGLPIPNSNPERPIAPPIFGTDDRIKLIASVLHDPCGNSIVPPVEGEQKIFEISTVNAPRPTISPLPSDGTTDALYATGGDNDLPGVYEVYKVVSHYTHDSGEEVVYSSKKGEDGKKIRYSNAKLSLRCEWTVSRIGEPPELPNPTDCPQNWVYTGGTASLDAIDLAADGVTPVHSAAGVFEYKCLTPEKAWVIPAFPPFLEYKKLEPQIKTSASGKKASRWVIFPLSTLNNDGTGSIFYPQYSTVSTGGVQD